MLREPEPGSSNRAEPNPGELWVALTETASQGCGKPHLPSVRRKPVSASADRMNRKSKPQRIIERMEVDRFLSLCSQDSAVAPARESAPRGTLRETLTTPCASGPDTAAQLHDSPPARPDSGYPGSHWRPGLRWCDRIRRGPRPRTVRWRCRT